MVACFVVFCKSGYRSSREKVSMFRAPKNRERFEKWKRAIPEREIEFHENAYVCAKHFHESEILRYCTSGEGDTLVKMYYQRPKLAANAVPSIFPQECPSSYYPARKKKRISPQNREMPPNIATIVLQKNATTSVSNEGSSSCPTNEIVDDKYVKAVSDNDVKAVSDNDAKIVSVNDVKSTNLRTLMRGTVTQNGIDPLANQNTHISNFEFVGTNVTNTNDGNVVKVEPMDIFENENNDSGDLKLPNFNGQINGDQNLDSHLNSINEGSVLGTSDQTINLFFRNIADTVKKFSPVYQMKAKNKILDLVNRLEFEYLRDQK